MTVIFKDSRKFYILCEVVVANQHRKRIMTLGTNEIPQHVTNIIKQKLLKKYLNLLHVINNITHNSI